MPPWWYLLFTGECRPIPRGNPAPSEFIGVNALIREPLHMISDTRPKVFLIQPWLRIQKPANESLNLVALSLRLVRRGCRNLHLVDQGHWLSSLRVLPDGLNCR